MAPNACVVDFQFRMTESERRDAPLQNAIQFFHVPDFIRRHFSLLLFLLFGAQFAHVKLLFSSVRCASLGRDSFT